MRIAEVAVYAVEIRDVDAARGIHRQRRIPRVVDDGGDGPRTVRVSMRVAHLQTGGLMIAMPSIYRNSERPPAATRQDSFAPNGVS
jgi:hypothetical protein